MEPSLADFGSSFMVSQSFREAHPQEVGLTQIPGDHDFFKCFSQHVIIQGRIQDRLQDRQTPPSLSMLSQCSLFIVVLHNSLNCLITPSSNCLDVFLELKLLEIKSTCGQRQGLLLLMVSKKLRQLQNKTCPTQYVNLSS